jgi:hypothetical protein
VDSQRVHNTGTPEPFPTGNSFSSRRPKGFLVFRGASTLGTHCNARNSIIFMRFRGNAGCASPTKNRI